MNLSKRRALAVMGMLAARGVDPQQMTTDAIGYHQPIAPNDTPEGRAMNRRVEFLISASAAANLAVVQERNVNRSYLSSGEAAPYSAPNVVEAVPVLQGKEDEGTELAVVPLGPLELPPPTENLAETVTAKPVAPPPTVTMRPAATIGPANLTNTVVH